MARRVRKNRPAEQSDLSCPAKSRPQSNRRETGAQNRLPASVAVGGPPPGGRRLALAVCTFLLLAIALVFGQTARHEFLTYDDNEYVYENALVTGGLTGSGIGGAFTSSRAHNWHPLTWLSHVLDWQLYGSWAGGHHLTNVLLHAAAAILLCLVLRRMTGAFWPSAFVAAVFAIHPLHVESVAWAAERKDVLSGLFFMLTLGAYAYYAARPSSWTRYAAVAAFYGLGLLSKPMLVTLPFVLLLLDYWPLGRMRSEEKVSGVVGDHGNWRRSSLLARLVVEKVPLLLMAAGSCVATVWAQQKAITPGEYLPFSWRVGNAAVSYVAYLRQFLYPAGLAVYYPHPGPNLPLWQIAAASCILLGITAAALVFWRRCPYLSVGWLWYLGTMVPVIGLVQVGLQARADRYTYLPQIGLYLALAWAVAEMCRYRRYGRWLCGLGGGLALAALMGCAWRQTSLWRNGETLWRHTLACTSKNPLAHNNLGNLLAGRGQAEEAIAEYRKALEIEPACAEAHTNLGNALAGRGQVEEAIAEYRKALEIEPACAEAHNNLGAAVVGRGEVDEAIAHYLRAVEIKPDFAEAHTNLGNALAGRRESDAAIAHYRKALEAKPNHAEAHNNLGAALADRGEYGEAIAHYRKALAIRPDYAEAHNNLGNALADGGEFGAAITHYQKALKIKPDYAEVCYNLGNVFAGQGEFGAAIGHYRKALEIRPDYAEAHNNLGNALASRGEFDEAIAHYQAVVRINPRHAMASVNLGRTLIEQGKCREAVAHWREVLRANPDAVPILNALAWTLATTSEASLRNGSEAIDYAQRAVKLTGSKWPEALDALAAAYAEAGDFPKAIGTAQTAFALAEQQKNATLVEALRLRIKLYRAGAPFREPALAGSI